MLLTGTPGTGKTSTAAAVAAATGLRHIDVGDAIKTQSLHSGWDDEFECHIVDEDKARAWRRRVVTILWLNAAAVSGLRRAGEPA